MLDIALAVTFTKGRSGKGGCALMQEVRTGKVCYPGVKQESLLPRSSQGRTCHPTLGDVNLTPLKLLHPAYFLPGTRCSPCFQPLLGEVTFLCFLLCQLEDLKGRCRAQ